MKKIFFIAKILFVLVFLVSTIAIGLQPYREASAETDGQALSLTVQDVITISVDETSALGNLTPGTPVTDDSTVTVATNSADGWALQIKRDDATSTMDDTSTGAIDFPDATAWTSGTPNSTTTPGANLSFRLLYTGTDAALYSSTWWGASDAGGTAKYAGLPSTSDTIATIASYVGTNQTAILHYRADAPATQQAVEYTGTVTLTAMVNV